MTLGRMSIFLGRLSPYNRVCALCMCLQRQHYTATANQQPACARFSLVCELSATARKICACCFSTEHLCVSTTAEVARASIHVFPPRACACFLQQQCIYCSSMCVLPLLCLCRYWCSAVQHRCLFSCSLEYSYKEVRGDVCNCQRSQGASSSVHACLLFLRHKHCFVVLMKKLRSLHMVHPKSDKKQQLSVSACEPRSTAAGSTRFRSIRIYQQITTSNAVPAHCSTTTTVFAFCQRAVYSIKKGGDKASAHKCCPQHPRGTTSIAPSKCVAAIICTRNCFMFCSSRPVQRNNYDSCRTTQHHKRHRSMFCTCVLVCSDCTPTRQRKQADDSSYKQYCRGSRTADMVGVAFNAGERLSRQCRVF